MQPGPEQRLSPEERGNLTAYLDGELAEIEARSIATKLSLSQTARRELDSLKRTWELLERLPRPPASPNFPERTLDSIRAVDAPTSAWARDTSFLARQALKLCLCLLVIAAAASTGFVLIRNSLPDPAERLERDRLLAEHLDEYQEIGSFDFLDELVRSREFGDER
ncbi:hypothetical protein OJF2_21560 [Aquisphaera giovannonii]|uniref:Uncharacterized protein n=1 Tax=Aquisphaera giovannonii TaxID=406548 RepID=A0A5B9VZ76_9BACT|nr:hypothetical protein [Aquisphaera giovannonii]QEH33652.1 hypothetical protein OJF2_21560 [Aquisphaera giovannonii]